MMKPDDLDQQLLALLAAELQTCGSIELVLRPESALQLAGLLQLALRHPAVRFSEQSRLFAVTALDYLRQHFAANQAIAVLEVLRRGDDPTEDV